MASYLVLASSYVQAWPSWWSCSPCHGVARRDATVPVVMALWHGGGWPTTLYVVACIIFSCLSSGVVAIVREQVAALKLLPPFHIVVLWTATPAYGVRARGGLAGLTRSRLGSCSPSHSGWGRMPVLSG